MRGYVVRIGVDQAYGGWNAPVDPNTKEFVYIPIPESRAMRSDLATPYSLVEPALGRFAGTHPAAPPRSVQLPSSLISANMHLDPDFDHLTYGDSGYVGARDLLILLTVMSLNAANMMSPSDPRESGVNWMAAGIPASWDRGAP